MADTKNPAKATPATKPEATKPEATNGEPKAKRARTVYQEVFPTAEAAVKEAESRTKGPRRAFTCKMGDKVIHCVGHNEGRAGGIAFAQVGGTVEELGKTKKSKPMGVEGIMAVINALPEAERAAVLAQVNSLKK